VHGLRVVWRFRFRDSTVKDPERSPEALRGIVATPIVAGGTVFVQDSTSSVYAIDRSTGKLRWEHRFRAPNFGRNGLSYSSGSVYGATDTTAFALSAATGRLLWQRRLVSPTEQFVDIAPLIANNLVYASTVGYPPGGRGALYALDAHSGAIRWRFATIRQPWSDPTTAGGGGAWYTPSVDAHGNVYWGTSNPYPIGGTSTRPNGSAYAGPARYTDSLLVLDGKTGRLLWADQVTRHDIRDYDFQLPPILVPETGTVLGAGKAGTVIAWNAATHRRLWQTSVGRHVNDTGPLPAHRVTVCPGFFGGVETPMAISGRSVFVPVVDLCARGSSHGFEPISALDPVNGTGEFLALDAATGKTLWRRTLPQPDFGCATAANGVVFTSTFDGHLYGFDSSTGATLWQTRAPAGINGCPSLSGKLLLVPAGSATSKNPDPPFQLVAYGLG
jgi:alcohol dehydrogenase (cytochrome c)